MWAIRRASNELRNKGLLLSYSKSSGFPREVHSFSSQIGAKSNGEASKNEFSGKVDIHNKEKMLKMMKERVYNADKMYRLMKDKVYDQPLHRQFKNKNKKIKRVELPTHYAEVNYRILSAVVFYKPNTDHIPLPKNHPLR